jgi:hypothetical protein
MYELSVNMITEFAKAILILNLVLLVFLLLVYIRKIKFNKEKQKFLFGLLFMVIILMIQNFYGLFFIKFSNNLFVVYAGMLTIALSGLLSGELSPLKRYLKEYKKK